MNVDRPEDDALTLVIRAPNTSPKMTEAWAFVSRDSAGRENVIGANTGLGMTALITGDARTFEKYLALARHALRPLEADGRTIHLLHFTVREEVEDGVTVSEHLDWAKQREYLDRGDTNNALASFVSDFGKHDAIRVLPLGNLPLLGSPTVTRAWIERVCSDTLRLSTATSIWRNGEKYGPE